jgi:hypothetical protein
MKAVEAFSLTAFVLFSGVVVGGMRVNAQR